MKKIILTIAILALSASAFAQSFDYEELDNFNKIELSKSGAHVETDLSFAFPMHFGWTTLTNINYKGDWAGYGVSNFLNFNTGKNFVYGLQLVGMDIRYGALNVNLGLRWTFMDFTFKDAGTTIRAEGNKFFPREILDAGYNYKKSKIHASYFGIPIRFSLNYGKATIYCGASIEYLVGGFAKYKQPKVKTQMKELFNPIRASIEGGFSYGNLGVFVQYGLTPLFPADLSDARTLTFGLLLGL